MQVESSRKRNISTERDAYLIKRTQEEETSTNPTEEEIKVFIRIKPSNRPSDPLPDFMQTESERLISIQTQKGAQKNFAFDQVLDPHQTQFQVFQTLNIEQRVDDFLNGYNCCIFAYGQTGSGKTYTMFGENFIENSAGIIPLALRLIFLKLQTLEFKHTFNPQSTSLSKLTKRFFPEENAFSKNGGIFPSETANLTTSSSRKPEVVKRTKDQKLYISVLEIYNETLRDLTQPYSDQDLCFREKQNGSEIQIKNLKKYPITSFEEAVEIISFANQHRHFGSTTMNERSSRSHTVVTLTYKVIEERIGSNDNSVGMYKDKSCMIKRKSKIHFVDLAGSERMKKAHTEGLSLKEGCYINTSLMVLSKVIRDLAENSRILNQRRKNQEIAGGNRLMISKTLSLKNFDQENFFKENRPADANESIIRFKGLKEIKPLMSSSVLAPKQVNQRNAVSPIKPTNLSRTNSPISKLLPMSSNEDFNQISSKVNYISYRDSKLTYFLKDSLGGNSKTVLIANVSSDPNHIDEIISTLTFAQSAKRIKNSVHINENFLYKKEIHAELVKEIKKLKTENQVLKKAIDNKSFNPKDIQKHNLQAELEVNLKSLNLMLQDLCEAFVDIKDHRVDFFESYVELKVNFEMAQELLLASIGKRSYSSLPLREISECKENLDQLLSGLLKLPHAFSVKFSTLEKFLSKILPEVKENIQAVSHLANTTTKVIPKIIESFSYSKFNLPTKNKFRSFCPEARWPVEKCFSFCHEINPQARPLRNRQFSIQPNDFAESNLIIKRNMFNWSNLAQEIETLWTEYQNAKQALDDTLIKLREEKLNTLQFQINVQEMEKYHNNQSKSYEEMINELKRELEQQRARPCQAQRAAHRIANCYNFYNKKSLSNFMDIENQTEKQAKDAYILTLIEKIDELSSQLQDCQNNISIQSSKLKERSMLIEKLERENIKLSGHNNLEQKIKHLANLKKEICDLKDEKTHLVNENIDFKTRYQGLVQQINEKHGKFVLDLIRQIDPSFKSFPQETQFDKMLRVLGLKIDAMRLQNASNPPDHTFNSCLTTKFKIKSPISNIHTENDKRVKKAVNRL